VTDATPDTTDTRDDAQRYRDAFASNAAAGDALGSVRNRAFEAFEATGFPTRKHEEWRYTNPAPVTEVDWKIASPASAEFEAAGDIALPDFGGDRLVFVDGEFASELSRRNADSPVDFTSLADAELSALPRYAEIAEAKESGLTAFNTALANDGAALRIRATDEAPVPLHVVFVSTAATPESVSFPRLWIHAEAQSRGRVIVDHVSARASDERRHFTCAVGEVFVGASASLDLTIVQRESQASLHVARHCVEQERDSTLRIQTLSLGGALVRNDLEVVLAASGSQCHLDGLFLGRDTQTVDNHTLVDHAVPHCDSHERYKGIVSGQSRGVFRGRVLVRPDAQQTNAVQQNQNLVLTPGAEIDTKPQLEIYADDVACSHGSSIGRLDEEALFFLRSRGLDPAFARRLLMSGFANEITRTVSDEAVRSWVEALIADGLDALTGQQETR
jgi:Fe-S cluster assembly protein SufD